MFEYRVLTTIPRNFDPDVEGVTIDSIVETCDGYIDHSVPHRGRDTTITIRMSKPLDSQYLIDQLDDNFKDPFGIDSVVKEIIEEV